MSAVNIKKSIESIDFFKGIAILLVLLVHSIQRFNVPFWVNVVPSLGQLGCQMFFVLSSFSLCLGYSDKNIKYFDFIKRRISKMIIGYWSMIVFYTLINILFAIRDNISILSIIFDYKIIINFLFLHGLSFDKSVINGVVRGGWFVGTITVLYLLFPTLLKLYNLDNSKWKKVRKVIFPLSAFCISCSVFVLLVIFKVDYIFENNSFSYFSFLNQLPCFALGFSLYEIYKTDFINNIKVPLIKFLIYSLISISLFFSNIDNVLIFISFFVALSFFYIFVYVNQNNSIISLIESNNVTSNLIKKFGKMSFSVYLTHPIIVHLLVKPLIEILVQIYDKQILWYFILLPIMIVLSYFLAKIFSFYENSLNKIIKKICHKN